ncbi:MAG: 6-bladed beta-propeller [Candidatus Aminicenantes bacterium]|nr:6-bladed beta-propeller [Candidatus Aminicenantes bacterium]
MRRQLMTLIIICMLSLIFSLTGCSKAKQRLQEISLEEDLSIGVESGDERYMFADIGRVALDSEENIYILDWKDSKIKKFDKDGNFLQSLEVKRGEGPQEASYITGMAVTPKGKIYAHDRNTGKILVFDEGFKWVRSFNTDFRSIDILPYSEEKFIILGIKDENVFHIFDQEGNLLESFGETFEIPSKYLQYENVPLVKLPRRADITRDRRIYLVNLHKYEIRVYEDKEVHHVIKEESEFFTPFKVVVSEKSDDGVQRIGMRFPYISVLEHGKRLYVSMLAWEEDELNHLDVFENEKLIASQKINGFAHAIDKQGRLYLVEEEEYPKVVRATINSNKKQTKKV